MEIGANLTHFLLLIDTCGAVGSIAVASTGPGARELASETLPGRAASEWLVPSIRTLLAKHEIALEELQGIAVVHGPGSFTGLRVGLSAAKGLSEALGIPLIALSRLSVLAGLAGKPGSAELLALLDAGRDEFYAGRYAGKVSRGESLQTQEQIRNRLAAEPDLQVVVCEPNLVQRLAPYDLLLMREPVAADALGLAARRLKAREFDESATLDGNYVRNTDLEIFAKPARWIPKI